MPTLLTSSAVTDEQRQQNDRHSTVVVIATLLVLFIYMYLFTRISDFLGLPSPRELADYLQLSIPYIFDREFNVGTQLYVHNARAFAHIDDSLLVLLLIVGAAFLSAYYLPLRFKQGSLALWSLLAVGLLYGLQAAAALLLAHLIVYLVFHPDGKHGMWISALAGLAGYLVFIVENAATTLQTLLLLLLPLLAMAGYRYVLLRLLQHERMAAVLRAAVIHAVILTIFVGLMIDVVGGSGIMVPLGIMLFFFQWARLVMYHIDYQDGLVPKTLSLDRYLAVFLSPGVLPAWYWAATIPQGYAYINNRFLCQDKNRIVVDGIKLLGIALLYLVFWFWAIRQLDHLFSSLGLDVNQASIRIMVHRFTLGDDIGTASVLLTTLLDMVEMVLVFVGVAHFKVAVWRICGYHIEPYFNKPWLATNLMAFWTRYGYYYREFLVRAFYYPVFFRLSSLPAAIRIVIASLAAAGLGNLITHLVKQNLQHGMHAESFSYVLSTWPYFLLLGLGIGVSMTFMRRRKRRRKPWTLDRWFIVDMFSVYVTIQYFSLIHIFARPTEASSLIDLGQLFMLGLGIDVR